MAYMMRNNNRYSNYSARAEYEAVKYERINPKELMLPIAMGYVPWQHFQDLYDIEKGFMQGTIFKELDKQFYGNGGTCR